MNQPNFQPQWGQPQQPMQQPMQQPQQQPQQFAQPGQFQPPGQPSQNLGAAAGQNLFNQFLAEPPRQRTNRAKPADGTYVIRFTANSAMKYSQQDGSPFALLEYQIIEGSVPQMNGQVFTLPIFWGNRMQLQDLADLAKYVFGQNLGSVAQQTQGNPQMMAQFICQAVNAGLYAGVKVQRSQKKVAQVGYEAAFAAHYWIAVSNQPMTLAQLGPVPAPVQQPQFQPQQFPQPPGQMTMPQQPPQGFQPAPAPAAWQPPAQAPQQPAFQPQQQFAQQPQMQQPPQQFQQLPQAAPALPQQQPTPAFFVPGGTQPPR